MATIRSILENEYKKWSVSRKQFAATIIGLSERSKYEVSNIFERWYLSRANFAPNIEPLALKNHPVTQKMKSEFLEKRIVPSMMMADKIIDKIIAIQSDPIPTSAPTIQNDIIRWGSFSQAIPHVRMIMIQRLASMEQIVAMVLRYNSIMPGGQQWAIPAQACDVLVKKFGVTIEGFASPLNSQIMRYAPTLDVHFCSLFPDVDRPFGSVGNFFDYDFVGMSAVINPPYVIDIMDAVVTKCIESCERAERLSVRTRMFIVVPSWTDADYYSRLVQTKYLDKKLIHDKFTHYYEDTRTGRPIIATFAHTIFILFVGGEDNAAAAKSLPQSSPHSQDYSELDRAFLVPRPH